MALAQQQADEWTAYTSTKEVNHLLVHQDMVWAATSGGVLRFDQNTQTYTRFTRLNGLAGNKVLSVAADAHGHMWFGTDQDGLSRFRPETETFDPPFLDFKDLKIQALAAAGDRIFVGMDRGVSAFLIDKEEVKETYRSLGSLPKGTEVRALEVFEGKLWAGTVEGMAWADLSLPNLQDPDSWTSNRGMNIVHDLVVFADSLFAVARGGVYVFNPGRKNFALDLVRLNITSLGVFEGTLVAAREDGSFFQRQDNGAWRSMGLEGLERVRALSRAGTALWIATAEGLEVVGAEPPPPLHEPPANQFYEIEVVDNGEVWIASVPNDHVRPRNGIYQFDGQVWTLHNRRNGLPTDVTVTLEGDTAGQVWVGTWGLGIAVQDMSGKWNRLHESNSSLRGIGASQTFVAISDIVRDEAGLMWIANVQVGLAVMDGYPPVRQHLYGQSSLGLPPSGSDISDIGKVAISSDGLKWISTPRNGFILFDDGGTPFTPGDEFARVINRTYDSRLSSDRSSDIVVDASGQVWVGTDNGLNAVRGTYSREAQTFRVDSWRMYNTSNGLPSSIVIALGKDTQGNVWVGTEFGLTLIGADGEVAITLTTANSGLINNRVNSLFFDDQKGELWIGTLDGLSRLQVNPVQNGSSAKATAYPNPFLLGAGSSELTFVDLPLGASLRIFSLDGNLVREIEGTAGRGSILWNGQNASGFLVGSGIYFFVAEDDAGNKVKGKFAVINTR